MRLTSYRATACDRWAYRFLPLKRFRKTSKILLRPPYPP